ncbi:MAG TPA: hypothetical protein VG248_02745 [Caulobacteraceae bacterium]|jgi:hypothetical protein|nr:hypothetical protein [Caulobacteraceae bacterium]
MAGFLLAQPVLRAIDANGAPMAGAKLQFYATGTTTPAAVYTSSTLGTPLSNPVVADSGGLFVPIYLDPTVVYRAQLLTSGATLIQDIDPISEGAVEATLAQVNAGSATGVYVSPAKLAGWTGIATALGYTPVNKAGDTATNLLLSATGLGVTSAGYLGLPVNEQDTSYTLVLGDAGKMVRGNNGSAMAYTIPPNSGVAYPVGTTIVVRNVGAGTVTITRGAGVTLAIAGSGTSKDVAMTQYGFATLVQEAANVWIVTGTGIS